MREYELAGNYLDEVYSNPLSPVTFLSQPNQQPIESQPLIINQSEASDDKNNQKCRPCCSIV